MRVVIATELLELRHFLTDVVEEQPGAVVVGQAGNALRAITTVNDLAPDVTIIDSNLPYVIGLDEIALSRVSGLDVAQGISEKRPKVMVILLTNLDKKSLLNHRLSPHDITFFLVKEGRDIPFTLQELGQRDTRVSEPVFASIGLRTKLLPKRTLRQRAKGISSDAIFLGGLGIIGGLLLIITWLLTPLGVVLAAAGLASVAFGLLTKFAVRLWPLSHQR